MGGIKASRGRFVIMGDADDSYDFGEIGKLSDPLREGADLVQGCRLPKGGGTILPGAMPLLHRWPGNPMLTMLVRKLFMLRSTTCIAAFAGSRGNSSMSWTCDAQGMEFATEMVIKSARFGKTIRETPITLHPDGRTSHPRTCAHFETAGGHSDSFSCTVLDGSTSYQDCCWFCLASLGYTLALPGISLFGATLDVHTLLVASLTVLVGTQSLQFGVFARIFAVGQGMLPESVHADRLIRYASPERGLLFGGTCCASG